MNRFLKFLLLAVVICFEAGAQSVMLEPKQDAKKPLWGYVNPTTGKWVVKPSYTVVEPFKKGPDGKYRALVTKGNLQGYLGSDGKPLGVGVVFESIEPTIKGNNLIVRVKGKKGIVNPDGVYLQKPDITALTVIGDDEGYIATFKDKKGVLSPTGETLISPLYSDVEVYENDYFRIKKGDKAGIASRTGEIILEPKQYTDVTKFGNYWKIKKGTNTGLYDSAGGGEIVAPKYADVLEPIKYTGGLILPVKKGNGKWGAINTSGKEIIKCKNQQMTTVPALNAIRVYRNGVGERLYFPSHSLYLEMESWSERPQGPFRLVSGRVAVPTVNTPDDKIVGLSFGEHVNYSNNYDQRSNVYKSLGDRKNFQLLIDKEGNLVGGKIVDLKPLGKDWLVIKGDGPWAVYTSDGELKSTTPLRGAAYSYSPTQGWYSDRKHVIFQDQKVNKMLVCGNNLQFIDTDGNDNWIPVLNDIPQYGATAYNVVNPAGDNSAAVAQDGKWGLFTDGKLKIPCKYSTPLRNSAVAGYYEIGKPGEIGLVTTEGKDLLTAQYDSITAGERKGLLNVYKNGILGLYNPGSEKWILPMDLKLKKIQYVDSESDSPIFISDGNWGVADNKGGILITPAYDEITRRSGLGLYECVKGNNTKYYDLSGQSYTPVPKGWLSDLSHEGDRYYGSEKGEQQWVDIHAQFLKGHRLKLICQVFNSNGTPHVSRGKEHIKRTYEWTVGDNTFFVDDQSCFIPYSHLSQGRYTEKNYFVKYTLLDETTGKVLDTAKISFGMWRH